MLRLSRLARNGALTDAFLITVFLVLVYVFMTRRGGAQQQPASPIRERDAKSPPSGNLEFDESRGGETRLPQGKDFSMDLIDERMKKVPDARPGGCRSIEYGTQAGVSVIIDFNDYQFYDLKITMSSVLHNTPGDLIKEFIFVDDGSTLEYIVDDAKLYVSKLGKVKLLRNEQHLGPAKARMVGAKAASSDILVFLDTNTICGKGWLEPLIGMIRSDVHVLAVPHFDSIKDPISYEYEPTVHNLVTSFSWSLAIRISQVPSSKIKSDIEPHKVPVMRGNAFAVQKTFFENIGSYDEGFSEMGGENMELSLRTWMCGGAIKITPCSRVGILNLADPVKLSSQLNLKRIVELWVGDKKEFIFRNNGIESGQTLTESERSSINLRRKALSHLQCKDFDWFLRSVGGHVVIPSPLAAKLGILKCKTGRCARMADDSRIELGDCSPNIIEERMTQMTFELDKEGYLKVDGRCLSVTGSAYIVAEDCRAGDMHQLWHYKDEKTMVNIWSSYCMMHVTDPDKKTGGKRQIAMGQECQTDTTNDKQFSKWDIIV